MKIGFAAAWILMLGAGGLAGAQPAVDRGKLEVCIYMYENGEYAKAVDSLRALLSRANEKTVQAEAYKYLAFSYVMLDMINTAKENFDSLLRKYPDMEIDTLTVPPNITVVFRQAKLESELVKQQEKEKVLRKSVGRESPAYWITGVSLAGAAGATGLYFTLRGFDLFDQYDAIRDPARTTEIVDLHKKSDFSFLLSYISYSAAGLSAAFGGYKFYRWISHQPAKNVSFILDGRGAALAFRF